MTRIRTIVKGFVDLNLEIDENVGTKIILPNTIQNIVTPISINPLRAVSLIPEKLNLPASIEDISQSVGITEPASITLAHTQGSRLYGVNKPNSDWDMVIVTTSKGSYEFRESVVNNADFDIHIHSPEAFTEKLENHNMRELEVIFHPENVRFVDKVEYSVEIDKNKLIETVKLESDDLWNRGERILNTDETDSYRALKNFWHSFRFLIFAKQILETGSISDFSAANYLYEPIIKSNRTDYSFFERNYSPIREEIKRQLDEYLES